MFSFTIRHRRSRKVRLRDGTQVTLRPVRPTDVAALRGFVQDLSPESRYLRFHAHVGDLSETLWKYLVSADGRDHVAVIAWIGRVVVGVARFIRLEGSPDKAEVAFVVADALQRRGLGSLLRDELLAAANRSGIRSFRAEVMDENRGMRRLLRTPSLRVESDVDGVIEVRLTPAEPLPGSATLLRAS
jgi:RimJ/RimL family protein N-acetyltransferase